MRKKIYQSLKARLKSFDAFLVDESYSKVNHYDLFKGQYIYPESHDEFPYPAIFFETAIEWEDDGNLSQKGLAQIRVHIVQEQYSRSMDGSVDEDTALRVLDFEQLIHECLHGYEDQGFTKLLRRGEIPDTGAKNESVSIVTYVSKVVDDTTSRLQKLILNDPTNADVKIVAADLVDKSTPVPTPPTRYKQ
jgi:hypothetical protein